MSAKKHDAKSIAGHRNQRELRRIAVAQGVPKFMFRLAAAQRLAVPFPETTVRHRHD